MDIQSPKFPHHTHFGEIYPTGNGIVPFLSPGGPKISDKANKELIKELSLGRG